MKRPWACLLRGRWSFQWRPGSSGWWRSDAIVLELPRHRTLKARKYFFRLQPLIAGVAVEEDVGHGDEGGEVLPISPTGTPVGGVGRWDTWFVSALIGKVDPN
ncbi:hypothetical protein SRHO_G00006040 [Serrasalmus rhombeus]